jgi:hypothetical protein
MQPPPRSYRWNKKIHTRPYIYNLPNWRMQSSQGARHLMGASEEPTEIC